MLWWDSCVSDHNIVGLPPLYVLKVDTVRFYNQDGIEIDVQDPIFFIDEQLIKELQDTIEEILSTYA